MKLRRIGIALLVIWLAVFASWGLNCLAQTRSVAKVKEATFVDQIVLVEGGSGWRLPHQRYRIKVDDGQVIEGKSNDLGETVVIRTDQPRSATLEMLRENGSLISVLPVVVGKRNADSKGAQAKGVTE
ncbi:hypothetical protein [Ralstonia sp. UBA689]|uniref:hypothetical protein n=1 Tax=Ralstonia sp. UBA689 TaxID=1947373 RepID=UPI0025D81E9B|nr:hypothetical protein [Ralstonia sp. UBA689]